MNDTRSQPVTSTERALVSVTRPSWCAVYLIPTGLAVFPAFAVTAGPTGPLWALALVLVGMLFVLRFGTAVLRRFVPVSAAVKNAWFEHRLLAKRHDSYQWQKLFWVGMGILIYAAAAPGPDLVPVMTGAGCAAVGLLGAVRWRAMQRSDRRRRQGDTIAGRTA